MKKHPAKHTARDEACQWWVRLDAGHLSAAERLAFDTWLDASQINRQSFEEVCELWGELDGMQARYKTSNLVPPKSRRRSVWRSWPVGLAAGLLLFAVASRIAGLGADYQTDVGATRSVQLDDGSTVVLSSNSALNVTFTQNQRHLELIRGEAWFEVAHDATRPFVVKAGRGTATALGTVYDVRHIDDQVQVAVIESRVAVDYADGSSTSGRIVVNAGEQTNYSGSSGPTKASQVDVDALAAWRRGLLVFENKPLGEVIAELNRYHRGIIAIAGDDVRDRPVNGVFRTDHPIEVIASLEQSLGLRSTRLSDYFILLHR